MLVYVGDSGRRRRPLEPRASILARVRFGADSEPRHEAPWFAAVVPNRLLLPEPAEEIWPAAGAVTRITIEGAQAAADDRSLFATIEAQASPGADIDTVALDAYARLLRGVEDAGYPHILRIWNYVPRIHDTSKGIDRYMLFCKGRSEAFSAHYGPTFCDRLPAASAVGCPGDTLVVHVLASREPARHVENPRQIAAHRYPECYGPKSPSFARGTVAGVSWEGTVFVSGTASILGHASVFPGDPGRQTEETLRNIEAVLDAAGLPGRGGSIGPRLSSLRVYARFPEQLETIRAALRASTGTRVPTTYLQAEICRPELLVEIEATARPRHG